MEEVAEVFFWKETENWCETDLSWLKSWFLTTHTFDELWFQGACMGRLKEDFRSESQDLTPRRVLDGRIKAIWRWDMELLWGGWGGLSSLAAYLRV